MFGHSCRHDKKRTNGLIVKNMAKMYGGKQVAMRETEIKGDGVTLAHFHQC
jgi:hypothetical protein